MQETQSRTPTLAAMQGEPFKEAAADGYVLGGFTWGHTTPDAQRPVVIINAATSVRCRHYSRFAAYLFANGFDVMTYDYRGIGESRHASIKGLNASWTDWGALDFEAMLKRAQREFPGSTGRCRRPQLWRLCGGAGRVRTDYPTVGHRRRAVRVLARLRPRASLAHVRQMACRDAVADAVLRVLPG